MHKNVHFPKRTCMYIEYLDHVHEMTITDGFQTNNSFRIIFKLGAFRLEMPNLFEPLIKIPKVSVNS